MEMSFSDLRTKEVVNTADGKRLGKICDIVFCYPENKILGFVVPGNRAFGTKKTDFFIDLKNIVKIGGDVVLVNIGCQKSRPKTCQSPSGCVKEPYPAPFMDNNYERRSYEEYE